MFSDKSRHQLVLDARMSSSEMAHMIFDFGAWYFYVIKKIRVFFSCNVGTCSFEFTEKMLK